MTRTERDIDKGPAKKRLGYEGHYVCADCPLRIRPLHTQMGPRCSGKGIEYCNAIMRGDEPYPKFKKE